MKKYIFVFMMFSISYANASECAKNETLIASCSLSGKLSRIATFCAKPKNGMIKYTYKNGMETELVVDFDFENRLKRWVDLATYTTYLGFSRGEYSYILSIPEEKPGVVAQLDVKKNNKIISSKQCDSNSFGDEGIKMNSIEDVSDDVVRDGGFKFP
ncbi:MULTISPECIES: hypothetical protein [Tatumella]|uniref:Uncharacterized protein n=1 Tax=Tatumella punctata TaxID=399969 RepID=A0ABW1VSX1_9GAMM|nr:MULTISPECIES: hypothetical protein [unclassified Tatumella]MBS0857131.1 hypothetical protein [Tatumella sp. JGM16]MBS0878494.1 hypothetical protein [Tatumella sp. JGM82]MBS0891973.1 hypothetical protein [Tatumella sp. JGM94]MBS0894729.1 hypothetical protein [Tatumella sp. JGM130]MBS0903091.1 hypothetical protein [Tatumella sp. JGM100]